MASPWNESVSRTYIMTHLKRSGLDANNRALSYVSTGVAEGMVSKVGSDLQDIFRTISLTYAASLRSRRNSLAISFGELGEAANNAVLNSYRRTHLGTKPYRANAQGVMKRFAGGRLESALSDRRMYLAGPDGLMYINVDLLDKSAAQWYRLNFGAGELGKASQRPKAYMMKFMGQDSKHKVSLNMFASSKPIVLPRGAWSFGGKIVPPGSPDPAHEFSPMSYFNDNRGRLNGGKFGKMNAAVVTRGIASRNFLDSGVAMIARGFNEIPIRMMDNVVREAIENPDRSILTKQFPDLDRASINRVLDYTTNQIKSLPNIQRQFRASQVTRWR